MTLLDSFGLEGRKALVVGTGPGIGNHVARAYAQAGADVVVAQRTQAKVDALAETIRAESPGRGVHAMACDAGDTAQMDRLVAFTNERVGTPDIVFYNAAASAAGRKLPSSEQPLNT